MEEDTVATGAATVVVEAMEVAAAATEEVDTVVEAMEVDTAEVVAEVVAEATEHQGATWATRCPPSRWSRS